MLNTKINANDFDLVPSGPRALVRNGFSQSAVFGNAVRGLPLLAFAIDGALDAPESIPAGSMRAYKAGPYKTSICRYY